MTTDPGRPVRVGYFAHDLSDPAVERRVRMLRLGGAEVWLAGFRRSERAPAALAGVEAFDLGRTYDARFLQRATTAAGWAIKAETLARRMGAVDLILARNLEMLALAAVVRAKIKPRPALIYECLDIHRMMLAPGPKGAAMRSLERALMDHAGVLMVSSPAFLSDYFEPRQGVEAGISPRSILVENKVLRETAPARSLAPRAPGRPWRILWPGIIRCRKSLAFLKDLAQRRPDLVEVVIRGRPTTTVFPDLAGEVAGVPNIVYGGPFDAGEVPGLYGDTHFTWAVDWFDEGLNSRWLLPNRLYEGGYYGSVPIAQKSVEIGRWLQARGLGVSLDDPARELEGFLDALTPDRYARLEGASLTAPAAHFSAGPESCAALVRELQAMAAA